MNMRRPRFCFILILLALLSQGVSAGYIPCDSAPAPMTNIAGEPEHSCHDDDPGAGNSLPTNADHDCAQQCACPPGSLTFAGPASAGSALTGMGPIQSPDSYRPAPATEALFRPPIQN